jgi:hypothetical protein
MALMVHQVELAVTAVAVVVAQVVALQQQAAMAFCSFITRR